VPNRLIGLEQYMLTHARGGDIQRALHKRDDVHMPRMDGITLVRQLRDLPHYKFTPMLILTTESSQEKKMDGKRAGATGWLIKPFDPSQLLATVARVL
jgi:two-component system, chemotaxis family, chemotaxis protein CheY